MRIMSSVFAVLGLLFVLAPSGEAKPSKTSPKVEDAPPPAVTPLNECGCYRDAQDQCHCNKTKKPKCVCENDCEPPGCEAERQNKADKEAADALKKIQERDKQKQKEARAAQAKKDKERATEEAKKKAEGGGRWK